MATILSGNEVVKALNEKIKAQVAELGFAPTLAILRLGERGDDISYEKGATKRCETLGIAVKNVIFPEDIDEATVLAAIEDLNNDSGVHGVLIFRPLPKQIDAEKVRSALSPAKDIDGITDGSLASVFAGTNYGFPPCTAKACIEILDYFNLPTEGKKAVVIGRSLVVGKPVSLMLMNRNATVTTCHTRTVDPAAIAREADILIVAAGVAGAVDASYLSAGQIVIDVGINVNDEGKLVGDVNFADADGIVEAITPVPGGVGTVTTSVLAAHVAEAAYRSTL